MTLALRSRLALVYTATFGLLLAAISFASYRVLAHQLDADADANLGELTSGLRGYLRFDGGTPTVSFDREDAVQAAFVDEATRYFQVFDGGSGQRLLRSSALEALGLNFTPAEVQAFVDQPRPQDMQTDAGRIRLSNSVISRAPGHLYLVQVGISLQPADRTLDRFLALLLVGIPLGLVGASWSGRWMAGIALTPLARLATAADSIDIADLHQRLPVRGTGDELDRVAVAFNETLARLEAAVGEMRQFSAALAHELRTPLTALRGEIEIAMRRAGSGEGQQGLASQLEEIDKLKKLIDQILMLARAESGEIPLALAPVDLQELAASLVDLLEPVAQAKGVALCCEPGDPVLVEGDRDWLKRLLLNLIDNAIKFTPPPGSVVVRASRDARQAVLSVTDTGIGISSELQPHIFERFRRSEAVGASGGEGIGIGLSLSKWIVDRHQGTIEVKSRPAEGSVFVIRLPLTNASINEN
jgi:heavy metal sensor kinase